MAKMFHKYGFYPKRGKMHFYASPKAPEYSIYMVPTPKGLKHAINMDPTEKQQISLY